MDYVQTAAGAAATQPASLQLADLSAINDFARLVRTSISYGQHVTWQNARKQMSFSQHKRVSGRVDTRGMLTRENASATSVPAAIQSLTYRRDILSLVLADGYK